MPKKQREALKLLEDQMFSDAPFEFPPALYNHLATSRWDHWGTEIPLRDDYPVHEVIALWQDRMLEQLLSPLTLERLSDSELKVPDDQDAFTTVELLRGLTGAIFSEVDNLKPGDYTNRKPAISSLRRNLQRIYLKRMAELALGESGAPEDSQTVATRRVEVAERPDRQAPGRPDQARRLQPRSSAGNVAADRQSARRPPAIAEAVACDAGRWRVAACACFRVRQ